MGIPSRYSAKAISGNIQTNDCSTLLNAGNVNPSLANNVSLSENMSGRNSYGSNIVLPVSPVSSGNTGLGKAISAGTIGGNTDSNYIAIMLGTKIAGVSTTILRNSASDVGQRNLTNYYNGYRREGLNSWDHNHIITKGPGAGDKVEASGINGVTGRGADDSIKFPGEFASMQGGPNPTQDDYNA